MVSAATSHGEYTFGAAVVVLYGFVECVARDSEPSEAQDSAVVEDLVKSSYYGCTREDSQSPPLGMYNCIITTSMYNCIITTSTIYRSKCLQ